MTNGNSFLRFTVQIQCRNNIPEHCREDVEHERKSSCCWPFGARVTELWLRKFGQGGLTLGTANLFLSRGRI